MKKLIKFVVGLVLFGVLLLLIISTLVGAFWLGPLVKKVVEQEGRKALGAEVKVEDVSIQLLRGVVQVKGLVVGNPEGFRQPSGLEVGSFLLNMPIRSLRDEVVVIDEILIDRPVITYEKMSGRTNLKELQQNVVAYAKRLAGEEKEKTADEKAAKKVLIKRLLVSNGVVHAKLGMLPVVKLDLPTIERTNIGESNEGGVSIGHAALEVFGSLTHCATEVVSQAGDVIKGAAAKALGAGKNVGDGVKGAGYKVRDGASEAVKGIGDLFKK